MSTGGAFWAAGNQTVKAASSPTPVITDALPKGNSDTVTQQKKGLVLKNKTNSTPSHNAVNGNGATLGKANGKKTVWADDEDDDSFTTEFLNEQKEQSVATLQTKITVQEERIKELEEMVVDKSLHIAELEGTNLEKDYYIENVEGTVMDKANYIEHLESIIYEKERHIEELKKENHQLYVKFQDLHLEVCAKDNHVGEVEVESKQHVTTQEPNSVSVSPAPASPEICGAEGTEEAKTEVDKPTTPTAASDTSKVVDPVESQEPAEKTTSVPEDSGNVQDAKATPGPSFNNSEFPTFITKETLKVVPPAPKPKTLTFPIDMSKYGKKPDAPLSTKKVRFSSPAGGKNGHTTPWGQSSKQARNKTDVKPALDHLADIRQMPHEQRAMFANGPDIIVKLGDTSLMALPKYILMQCSKKASDYFTSNPDATTWVLPADSMDAEAAKAHLSWMEEMTYQGRVYSLTLNTAPAHDLKNLRICRAARVLGMNNTYVGHFTKQFCDRIRNKSASYEFMDTVCELAYPENDPIFECLANNLATRKVAGGIKDADGLEKLMAKHAVLRTKMAQIEKKLGGRARK